MEERAQRQAADDERSNDGDRSVVVRTLYKLCRPEWSNNAVFVILGITSGWVLLFIPVFWLFGYSFSNVDPLFFVSSFVASRRFGTLFEFQTFAFGQGFGAFQYPTILDIFWWVFTFSDSVQVAYIFTEISLVLCVLSFCFWLSRNLLVSIASGFLTAAVFFIPRLFADHFGTVAPQHILQIALCYLALALIGFGLQNRVLMAVGLVVLVYVAMMNWLFFVFVVPLLGLGLAAQCMTMLAAGWRIHLASLISTIAIVVLFIAFLYLSGLKEAYDNFTLMSARAWVPTGLLPAYPLSLLIFGGVVKLRAAYVVGVLSIVAMIYFVVTGRRQVFFLSLFVLAYLAVLVVVDVDSAGADIYWTLPAVGYFERPLIPFYVIVITYASSEWIERMLARKKINSPFRVPAVSRWGVTNFALAVTASCGIATLAIIGWLHLWYGDVLRMVHRPPYYFERTIAFIQTLPFRKESGRLFQPYFYDATRDQLIYGCPHLRRDPWDNGAVRYCGHMLPIISVPNFIEFQNLLDLQITKLYEQAHGTDLATARNIATATSARLKSFGIRYLALDGTVDGAIEKLDLAGHQVSLLDLGPITPADLSVRSLVLNPVYRQEEVISAREEHVAVVHEGTAYRNLPLVPATLFDMSYDHGEVTVHVQSTGDSVVLLPFQFSYCLRLAEGNSSGAELLMVNGGQAALRFTKEAKAVLVNTFRYFDDARCRRRDFISVFRHKIWPVNTVEDLAMGRRIPFVMKRYLAARFRYRDQILQDEKQ
jgi:hypothetical protein